MAKIFPLSEGVFTVGHDKQFLPFNLDTDQLNERSRGSLLVEIQPFLVEIGDELLVLDTGLGFKNTAGVLQIHDNIRCCGYEPEQVTKVLMSHLHKDHSGGVVYKDDNGLVKTTFPIASYCIYRAEADFALKTGYPSYHPSELEPLLSSNQVYWLDGAEGMIGKHIHYIHSGAHCPEHIVFLLTDGDEKIFFGGDEAPQLKQMKMKYIAKYDYDGKKAMALREQYAEQGHREGWRFLFYHDVKTPVSNL